MKQYKLICGCFLICALCYGLKCEVCKRDGIFSYHCEGLCNGSVTIFCDECCKLNGTWRCVVSTRYHQCETSSRTTTTRAYNRSISEKNKASGTLSTGAAIALGAGAVVIVIFVILYVLKRRLRLTLPNNNTRTNNGVGHNLQQPTGNPIVFISGSDGKSVVIASTNLSYAQQSSHNLPPSYSCANVQQPMHTVSQ
ncbi:uncharacterized protein LOC127714697 [Mytilus californianus]|uniref:uncharacterized protein LOC127714697 n=1 Tax=Mytilus californianus TaxID=6549 RepID=UPI0022464504|nr:uncharacterized protein LOC127714697 [Mytilus californianus]